MRSRGAGASLSGRVLGGLLACVAALAIATPAQAEDLKGRWYFGGHLGYLSTTDDIRSNANIIIGPLGDDNIPFTGDPNEEQGCVGQQGGITYCDPRPDDLLSRETAVEETFRYDIEAGFGLTSWLNIQLDASYFKGDVGPVDTYLRDHFPIAGNIGDPGTVDRFKDREVLIPVQAGEVTQIPVTLSAIARFRKDSPLNPYVGVGFGMIFADMERGSDVDELNARLSKMRIRALANEFDDDITPAKYATLVPTGRVPFENALRAQVDDSFVWHLSGGAEYFFNDRMSFVFDAKYLFADEYIQMDLGGEDQLNLLIFSEEMFRSDGTTAIFAPTSTAPNTECEAVNWQGTGCNPYTRPAGQLVSPTGKDWTTGLNNPDPTDEQFWRPIRSCPSSGDFDRDGQIDRCYGQTVIASPAGFKEPRGDVVVQGGRIRLSGFAVAVGMRFHF